MDTALFLLCYITALNPYSLLDIPLHNMPLSNMEAHLIIKNPGFRLCSVIIKMYKFILEGKVLDIPLHNMPLSNMEAHLIIKNPGFRLCSVIMKIYKFIFGEKANV